MPNDLCPKVVFGVGEGRGEFVYLGEHLAGLHSLCTPVIAHPSFHKTLVMNFYNLMKKILIIIFCLDVSLNEFCILV